jgi:Putative peptidoglycan binding domain
VPEQTLAMWDASTLPDPQPTTPVAAFYVGGDTPHVYTDTQIKAIRARYGVPIWTGYDFQHDGAAEAAKVVEWLHRHGWKGGTLVAVDTEELVIPDFLGPFNTVITQAGWLLLHYESKVAIAGNPPTSGGKWAADWTGIPHLRPGDTATQYVPDKWLGALYDLSLILASAPLHELNPPVVAHVTWADVAMRLPVLGVGMTGPAVARMQHLLEAWYPASTGPGDADGIFGPDTLTGLMSFQRAHGIHPATGACDGPTWARLVEG